MSSSALWSNVHENHRSGSLELRACMNPYLRTQEHRLVRESNGGSVRPESVRYTAPGMVSESTRPAVNGSGVGSHFRDHRAGDNNRIDKGAVDVKTPTRSARSQLSVWQ